MARDAHAEALDRVTEGEDLDLRSSGALVRGDGVAGHGVCRSRRLASGLRFRAARARARWQAVWELFRLEQPASGGSQERQPQGDAVVAEVQ